MDREQSNCCLNWKITGVIIGWLGIILSIALIIMYAPGLVIFEEKLVIISIFLMIVLNLVASIIWLFGIHKRKSKFVLMSLFWWAIPLSLWIGFVCYVLIKGACDVFNGKKPYVDSDHLLHIGTAFCLTYYFVAVISYKSMKEELKRRSEIPRLDVSYAIPGDNKDFEDIKCLNLLNNA